MSDSGAKIQAKIRGSNATCTTTTWSVLTSARPDPRGSLPSFLS